MKKLCTALFLIVTAFTLNAQVNSPRQFLPNYGKHVTYYDQLEDYFEQLVQQSDYIMQQPYGETPEERALNVYFISTPENLKELQNIRENHLYSIGMADKKPVSVQDKAIVWLSFNVHGNEPAAAESAMSVAYELVNPENVATKEWLKNTIVILDPCLNPDGFAHYTNWLRSVTGWNTHPGADDREHMEPWPGGRQNHYAYDLNRDWAWQTQPETQQRMLLYNEWMPMVHVDVHEMGYNEPYFFPPAAEPIHDFIAQYQKDFHNSIGENTSKKFDAKGWSYYTRERFDLFYPSYGDTYPCFNGAVGMTYEQGGINAGRAIKLRNGTILTLQDRIDHHTMAVLTALETASKQKDKLVKNFRNFFKESRENPKGKYKSYVLKNSGKTLQMTKLLERNKIAYAYADETKKTSGYHYQSDSDKDFTIEPNDIIVSVNQPKAVLTQVLFEPYQHLSDSLSYDITAWALPHAYGIESYALKNNPSVQTKPQVSHKGKLEYDNVYAYYIPWNGRESVKVLASLHQNNIQVRMAQKESLYRGIRIKKGDLIVLTSDNKIRESFIPTMDVLLADKPDYEVIESGFSVEGADLGGEYYALLKAPKVMLLSGSDISATDFGQVWFYMEQIVNYPLSIVELQNFDRINFTEYNTLILPDGNYSFTATQIAEINSFIEQGGKVMAMGKALGVFEDATGYSLTKRSAEDDNTVETDSEELQDFSDRLLNYDNLEREAISNVVPGAIIENILDKSHPLAYGLGDSYYSLKTDASRYKLLKGAENVIYVPANYKSFGFIGHNLKKNLENTVTFAVERKGAGQVIYMVDNPLFRGFWENGNLLFSNALFLVN
ncbi:hypothetical protein E0W68_05475 [Flavobacterium salilacus subsp. salilacus]|uniref:M14 family zinc carboxypeptidase n=1 Tax=Flavobacterium TaxID=237 RepID=UPI0010751AE8|nr:MULTISPECIES: M14 family zinc carboxypeptidase [Flavobacterium]KAF2519223.1 hypothetical protein E0W68_05475 [Flavobacterium salilacus subsp. salilacus]MBE1613403.1 hypothetical protein [Flavobacterium sp. SaA2.13]